MKMTSERKVLLSEKNSDNLKVDDIFEKKMSSSSPPASWIERYKIEEINNRGVWGRYIDSPSFHEYSGKDME